MRSSRLLLAMTASLAVAIVFSDVTTAGAQKRGGTLRVAYGNEIAGLDFHTTPGYEMVWVATNIGCGLVGITPDGKFTPGGRRIVADLARRSPLHVQAQEERPLP